MVPGPKWLWLIFALALFLAFGGWKCTSAPRTLLAQSFKSQAAELLPSPLTVEPGGSSSSGQNVGNWPWVLVWSDEFNKPDGSAPDSTKWAYDEGVGQNGWGNNELQYYTTRSNNVVIRNGNLVITALRETFADSFGVTRNFTSARLKTRELFSQLYGRFEARIKIPWVRGFGRLSGCLVATSNQ